jgi:hypothetical protein
VRADVDIKTAGLIAEKRRSVTSSALPAYETIMPLY